MDNIRVQFLIGCALFALFPLGRIVFLFGWREPRVARVGRSDYSKMERAYDEDFHRPINHSGSTAADLAHYIDPNVGPNPFHLRDVTARAAYTVDGQDYRSDIEVTVHMGESVDRSPIIWVDPGNPQWVTARGPGYWLQWLLLDLFVAVPAWWWLR